MDNTEPQNKDSKAKTILVDGLDNSRIPLSPQNDAAEAKTISTRRKKRTSSGERKSARSVYCTKEEHEWLKEKLKERREGKAETKPAPADSKTEAAKSAVAASLSAAKLDLMLGELVKVKKEIWYSRIALLVSLLLLLLVLHVGFSNINDSISVTLQFLMSAINPESN